MTYSIRFAILLALALSCSSADSEGPIALYDPAPPNCGKGLTRDKVLEAVDRAFSVMGGDSEPSVDRFFISLRPHGCDYLYTAISLGPEQGPSIVLVISRDGKNKTPPWCWFLEECGELEGESPPEVRKD
jgi:hypothetical protein